MKSTFDKRKNKMLTQKQNSQNLDMFLEILNGCQYSCSGCLIDKTGQQDLDLDDVQSLSHFVDQLQENNITPVNCTLGPTDFMTAATSEQCLIPEVAKLTSKFKCVVFNSTFLRSDIIEKYARIVNEVFAGQTFKLAIPIELKHLLNQTYRNTIVENRNRFIELTPNLTYRKTYWNSNIVDYKNMMEDPINRMGFVRLTEVFEEFAHQHLDLIVTAARLDLSEQLNKGILIDQLKYYNGLFEKYIVDGESIKTINFTYANEHEGFNHDLTYRNGKLYHPPFIGDPLTTFDPAFCLGEREQWTASQYVDFRQSLFTEAIIQSQDMECCSCEYLQMCAGRRFINMMSVLEQKDCLAPRNVFNLRARQVWN